MLTLLILGRWADLIPPLKNVCSVTKKDVTHSTVAVVAECHCLILPFPLLGHPSDSVFQLLFFVCSIIISYCSRQNRTWLTQSTSTSILIVSLFRCEIFQTWDPVFITRSPSLYSLKFSWLFTTSSTDASGYKFAFYTYGIYGSTVMDFHLESIAQAHYVEEALLLRETFVASYLIHYFIWIG